VQGLFVRTVNMQQFVRNSEISALTGLPAINDVIRHRRIAVFGHIARLQDSTPAHKALQSHVNLSLGRLSHPSWSRRLGRPRGRWINQIRNDTSQTPADLWRQALGRGHHGRTTRRPTLAMRWSWWWVTDDEIRRVFATVFTNSRDRSVPTPRQPPLAVDSSDELTDWFEMTYRLCGVGRWILECVQFFNIP